MNDYNTFASRCGWIQMQIHHKSTYVAQNLLFRVKKILITCNSQFNFDKQSRTIKCALVADYSCITHRQFQKKTLKHNCIEQNLITFSFKFCNQWCAAQACSIDVYAVYKWAINWRFDWINIVIIMCMISIRIGIFFKKIHSLNHQVNSIKLIIHFGATHIHNRHCFCDMVTARPLANHRILQFTDWFFCWKRNVQVSKLFCKQL